MIRKSFLTVFFILIFHSAHAQFFGSASTGVYTSSNVVGVDSSAPDVVVQASLTLGYDLRLSPLTRISLSAGVNPNEYTHYKDLSYTSFTFNLSPSFYLSNRDDIRSANEKKLLAISHNSQPGHHSSVTSETPSTEITQPANIPDNGSAGKDTAQNETDAAMARQDSDKQIIISRLYDFSNLLDSSDINDKGISEKKSGQLSDLKDSISNVTSTLADLLDSLTYGASVKDMVLGELTTLRNPLSLVLAHITKYKGSASTLDSTISLLGRLGVLTEANDEQTTLSDQQDSSKQIVTTRLYDFSSSLDSSIINDKGISTNKSSQLSDLKDSISNVTSTLADLLDSLPFDETVKEVVVGELTGLNSSFSVLYPHLTKFKWSGSTIDSTIAMLNLLSGSSDAANALASTLTAGAPGHLSSEAMAKVKQTLEESAQASDSKSSEDDDTGVPSPLITLVSSSTRFRSLSASDFEPSTDLADSDATTLATLLAIPASYESHTSGLINNPNDYRSFTAEAGVDAYPASSSAVHLGYGFTHELYPYDSVYSSNESRFRLSTRLTPAESSVLLLEGSYGLKDYTTPLHFNRSVKTGNIIKVITTSAPSAFSQFTFGAGWSQYFGTKIASGLIAVITYTPNLRAYITDVAAIRRRAQAQISDDEYTYDLKKITGFFTARIFENCDLPIDISYEHRQYGSEVRQGTAVDPVSGSSRTEDGLFLTGGVNKNIYWDDRWLGIFTGMTVEALVGYATVNSSVHLFSYRDFNTTLTGTLNF